MNHAPRKSTNTYDELVRHALVALKNDDRTIQIAKRLRLRRPDIPALCAFLTAVCYADIRRVANGRPLTPWDFLLEQIGVSETTLTTLPDDLERLGELVRATSEILRRLRDSMFDPARDLRRSVPGEKEEVRKQFAKAAAKFRYLPKWMELYADCLEGHVQDRRAFWGHPHLKLATLNKALLTRYVREHSRAAADRTPAPVYASCAELLDTVSRSLSCHLSSPTAKALQRIDDRAQNWADQNKLFYDTFYSAIIRLYSKP